jgi:dienelactone hydrolase
MKRLVLLISVILVAPVSIVASAQQSTQDKPQEIVVAYEVAGMNNVIVKKDIPYLVSSDSSLKMDVYYPPDFDFRRKIPAIVFVFGYTNDGQLKTAKHQLRTWSPYTSWCRVVAASGMAAIVYETINPENDLQSIIQYISSNKDNLNIDLERMGAYSCSANTPTEIAYALNDPDCIFRCAVVYYGIFLTTDFKHISTIDTLSQNMGFVTPRLSEPASWNKNVPLMIVHAGKDLVLLTESLTSFVGEAIVQNIPITLMIHSDGIHAFDLYTDNEATRQIIRNTLEFWKYYLK